MGPGVGWGNFLAKGPDPRAAPPYRALRIVLSVFSLLAFVGSVLMIASGKSLMMRVLMRPPESEVSTLLLFIVREMGGFAVMLSLMLFIPSRDPVRNVAIIDAVIVGLAVLAVTPLISLARRDILSSAHSCTQEYGPNISPG